MPSSSSSFSSHIEIHADRGRVFDVLVGLEATANWIHGILAIERLSEGPMGVGSRWRERRMVLGEKVTDLVEVVGFEEARLFSVRCTPDPEAPERPDSDESRTMTYTLADGGSGEETVLRLDARVDNPGLVGRMLARFRIDTLRKTSEKDLFALKRFIETGRRASGVFIAVS
ncbi:MAG TPA: SRPBCC family protein [Polyangiaceae bacterium LLY-WYZ-14_1]|nr:SRPBCC family protein [Polyangiaceae bacterium LLY-WYZ-14_1]